MKFGKQFSFYKIPEWSEFYFDYIGVKTVLKFIDPRRKKKNSVKKIKKLKKKLTIKQNYTENTIPSNNFEESSKIIDYQKEHLNKKEIEKNEVIKNSEDISKLSNDEKLKHFIKFYISKVKVIDEFFTSKLNEYYNSYKNLKNKINEKKNSEKDKENKIDKKLENAERDELGYAVSWKRAISNLYNHTSWLHSYYSINNLALQKIQKKSKKIFKLLNINNIGKELIEADATFDFFKQLPNLVELRKKIKNIYAQELTNGSLSKASIELDARLMGGTRMKQTKLIYFYLGVIIMCILFLIVLNFMKKEEDNSLVPFFPAFNFSFAVIMIMLGVGINLVILRKYRINYIYIFEIDPKLRLGPGEMFQNGLLMLSVWLILIILTKLTLNFKFFGSEYSLFSLILNCLLIIFFFFPFHCMYYSFRQGIIVTLIRNLFPFGKNTVRFKDFLFGDILTSLNKPFTSLILSFCLLSCRTCRAENVRISDCNRDTIPCFIILLYPFFIRLTQCINRYYYTRMAWPHLGNTIKYVGGLLNVIFTWLYGKNKSSVTRKVLHIVIGCLSQGYMLFWDFFVDWGCGDIHSKNFFLRDKIVYPKYMYYGAMFINAILRFSWTWNFIHINKKYDEWKNFIMAILEAYRRIQWCIFRIENENTNNPEKYRAILAIPELPMD